MLVSDFRRRLMLAATANSTTGGEITLMDGSKIIGHVSREADITQIADALDYSDNTFVINGTSKLYLADMLCFSFAGWTTKAFSFVAGTMEEDKVTSLADAPDTIYAQWINAGYLKPTIAYYSNKGVAARVFAISTVPDDIFSAYGFILSTKNVTNENQLVIGGSIDGTNVGNIQHTTVYDHIDVRPFSTDDPKTANDFNGGLGGANREGTNGYIAYASASRVVVGVTYSARAYYQTKDGTIVYGTMEQKVLLDGTDDTGLEETTTEPVTPPTVDI